MMKKRFFSALLCLCLLVGLVPGAVTTAFAASTTDYAIGDTVEFGGYSWRIIGTDNTEDGGVTAPAGCYTLLIADDVFGSTAFREGADGTKQSDNYYKDSDLQKAMEEIAADFSFVERQNIVPRDLTAENDEIAGPDVTGQYVWALSETEARHLLVVYPEQYRYWTRTNAESEYFVWSFSVPMSGASSIWNTDSPSESNLIFPALYVRASALPAPATGDFVLGQDVISGAAVGGRLVANSGSDVGLTISQNQTADVRVYESEADQSGSSLSFCLDHQSTTTGENQVLACVLTDGSGTVKYYGMLADCSVSDSRAIWVSVPMLWVADGTYTLSIFSHNIQTNEISQPSPTMTVTVDGGVGTASNYNGQYKDIVIVFPDPVFTKQPQSQYVTPDSSVTFTVEAAQNGIPIEKTSNYTWWTQDKSNPDGTWYQISGWPSGSMIAIPITGTKLTLSNVSGTWSENDLILQAAGTDVPFQPKDARFRCVVTGNYSGSVTSNAAELWVIEGTGEDGREVELRTNDTHIQWRYEGEADDAWRDLVALDAVTGEDGREVELQIANGYIQWRYTTGADTDWKNLMPLSDLKGEDGEDGDTPYIGSNGNWWIGTTDTGVRANGKNGSSGSDGSDGRDGRDGKDGEDGLTPFIGSNGNWWIGAADTGVPAAGADGAPGRDGVGISGLFINEAGELVITLTDGTENNLGRVTGEDGAGIAGISISEAGELIVTLTDGTELNAGAIPTDGPEMSCLRLLVYLALGMSALSLTGLLVAGGLWYRRRRASRS